MANYATPKTNWVATDYFNAVDYNRIKNNLRYLSEVAVDIFGEISIQEMGLDLSYGDLPYASLLNKFEDNLETINNNTLELQIGTRKTFTANGAFITYSELNRIESAIKQLYDYLYYSAKAIPVLEFELGKGGIF